MAADNDSTDLSFSQRYDRAIDDLRAIKGIAYVMAADDAQEDAEIAVASHLGRLAGDAIDELEAMWERHRAEYDAKPDPDAERSELTPANVDTETKALAARIVAQPEYAVRQLMDLALNVVTAHKPDLNPNDLTLDEIESLLARLGPGHVHAFWWLKHKGVAQLVEAPISAPRGDSDDSAVES